MADKNIIMYRNSDGEIVGFPVIKGGVTLIYFRDIGAGFTRDIGDFISNSGVNGVVYSDMEQRQPHGEGQTVVYLRYKSNGKMLAVGPDRMIAHEADLILEDATIDGNSMTADVVKDRTGSIISDFRTAETTRVTYPKCR